MQFISATLILTITALASAGRIPADILSTKRALLSRATCDTTPSATSGSVQPLSTVSASTAADCQTQCDSNSQCQSFVFGTAADGSIECLLYNVPASEVPVQSGDLKGYDKSCANVPTTAPSTSGTASSTGTSSGTGANNGAQPGQKLKVRDICGSAPTGSSSQAVSPLQTLDTVNSATDCLNLCKQTSGCMS